MRKTYRRPVTATRKTAQESEYRYDTISIGAYDGRVIRVTENYEIVGYYWEAWGADGWWESDNWGHDYYQFYEDAEEDLTDFLYRLNDTIRDASRNRKAMKKRAWWSAGFTLEQLLSAVAPYTDVEIYNYIEKQRSLFRGDIAEAKAWLRDEGSEYAIQGVCGVSVIGSYLTIGIND